MTALFLAFALSLIMPFGVIAAENSGEGQPANQQESKVIDDPNYELDPGIGGGTGELLFSMTANKVDEFLRSDERVETKKFYLSDLPEGTVSIRIEAELFHSKYTSTSMTPIRVGVCYHSPISGKNEPAFYYEAYSGEEINKRFTVSEHLGTFYVYYGYIKNNFAYDGYVYGTAAFYTHKA